MRRSALFLAASCLLAASTAADFDNCAHCSAADPNPYQRQCQNPNEPAACYPKMSDDTCPPGTLPCTPYKCPPNSYQVLTPPMNITGCKCNWGFHVHCDDAKALAGCSCVQNSTQTGLFGASLDCKCAPRSQGYECRDPKSLACYPKNGGVCPGGTQELPNCCDHCAAGSVAHDCQDSTNLACFASDGKGNCPAGTMKCPTQPPAPGPAPPPSGKCRDDASLCAKEGGAGAYCGASTDPDAVFPDGSGCSCAWSFHVSKNGTCAAGSCQGHCHSDATRPCLGKNAPTCFGLLSDNTCPPGTSDCRY
eukprot:g2016.t1